MEEIRKIAEQRRWTNTMLLDRVLEYINSSTVKNDFALRKHIFQPDDSTKHGLYTQVTCRYNDKTFKDWDEMLSFVMNFIKEMNLHEDCAKWLKKNYKKTRRT